MTNKFKVGDRVVAYFVETFSSSKRVIGTVTEIDELDECFSIKTDNEEDACDGWWFNYKQCRKLVKNKKIPSIKESVDKCHDLSLDQIKKYMEESSKQASSFIKIVSENFEKKKNTFDPTIPVQTRDGRKARIVCTDVKRRQPILALISDSDYETVEYYCSDGKYNFEGKNQAEDCYDLINIPEPKPLNIHVGGVYKGDDGNAYILSSLNSKGSMFKFNSTEIGGANCWAFTKDGKAMVAFSRECKVKLIEHIGDIQDLHPYIAEKLKSNQ